MDPTINLAGRPLTPARFFDLAYGEAREVCSCSWKSGPVWTVIQFVIAYGLRLHFTFDAFQSPPLFFIGFLVLSWAADLTFRWVSGSSLQFPLASF